MLGMVTLAVELPLDLRWLELPLLDLLLLELPLLLVAALDVESQLEA
jgi:hypothetical protein